MKDTHEKIQAILDHMRTLEEALGLNSKSQESDPQTEESLSEQDRYVDVSDFCSAHVSQAGGEACSAAIITTSKPDPTGRVHVTVGMAGDLNDAGDNLGAIVVQSCLALKDVDACERMKSVGVGIVERLTSMDIDDLDAFILLLDIIRKHRTDVEH